MKIRMHRGGLAEAMATVEEIEPTLEAVRAYLERDRDPRFQPPIGMIKVKPYGYDERIDWDTHIVVVDGVPMGWTDGPLPPGQEGIDLVKPS